MFRSCVNLLNSSLVARCPFLFRLVEASTMPTIWRRWRGRRASRSTTIASASVQMPGCICGTEGGRSSTWTGDHVRHSLPFPLLNFLELIEIIDENAEAALVTAARKELAYLEQFGRPLQPFQRERREAYGYKEQSPSDHIKNLERYLLIAPLLVPKNSALHNFRIRHPDLLPSNVIVVTSSESNRLEIVGLLDWRVNTPRSYPRFSSLVCQVTCRTTMTQSSRLLSHPHCRQTWTTWTNLSRATQWNSTTAVSSTSTTSRTRRYTTSSITVRCRTPRLCSPAAFSAKPVLHGRVRPTR